MILYDKKETVTGITFSRLVGLGMQWQCVACIAVDGVFIYHAGLSVFPPTPHISSDIQTTRWGGGRSCEEGLWDTHDIPWCCTGKRNIEVRGPEFAGALAKLVASPR